MGETSIEWCRPRRADGTSLPGFTFSPWWGCQKVSEACNHCYADTFATRVGHGKRLPLIWGAAHTDRRFLSDDHWKKPLLWNRQAERAGERYLVFSASMADVFEDRPDLVAPRARLFGLIDRTPHLSWLLLTKRPENMIRLAPPEWILGWPKTVWAGCTAENQQRLDERLPWLLDVPCATRFLSCEPLLSALDMSAAFGLKPGNRWADCLCADIDPRDRPCLTCAARSSLEPRVHWILAGGESGPKARVTDVAWARSLRDQCATAGAAFLWKQWGEWAPTLPAGEMKRLGKARSGRLLDAVEHHAFPEAPHV